jgi:hypothetical protein
MAVSHFGLFGHTGGGFYWFRMVATDSKGNVYTGEMGTGKRDQGSWPRSDSSGNTRFVSPGETLCGPETL